MLEIALNLISLILVSALHIFIYFKLGPLMTSPLVKFVLYLSSNTLVLIVYTKFY